MRDLFYFHYEFSSLVEEEIEKRLGQDKARDLCYYVEHYALIDFQLENISLCFKK